MNKSVEEVKKYHTSKEAYAKLLFESAQNALKLLDLSKTETRTFSTFSKDKLRSYMKNPFANIGNLRALSRFLCRLSYPYRRLILYNAEMIDLSALSVVPKIDFLKSLNLKGIKKDYFTTLKKIEQMNMEVEILKLAIVAWREDAVFGYIYDDDQNFYIQLLDGDYCKISSVEGGKLNFAYDFSYFRSHSTDLEYWDPEFSQKYNTFTADPNERWQELDPEKTICFKVNIDDLTLSLPPFLALFEQIIDLIDLQSLQSVKDELSIYKLLVLRLETLAGATLPDDFSVDPDTAIDYYKRLCAELPDSVAAILSPVKIDTVEFKGNTTEDVDMISNSMSNLFKNSGGSQILNNGNATGTTAFTALIKADTASALKSLLPQIETWMNYYLTIRLGENHSTVKYMDVSYLTKQEKKKELLTSGQYGVPVKLALAALDGFSPLETLSLQVLENDVLELDKVWIPLMSSHTQSGTPTEGTDPLIGGRPPSDDLSDEGEATKEGNKNDKK